jgi:arsenite methyltransferase
MATTQTVTQKQLRRAALKGSHRPPARYEFAGSRAQLFAEALAEYPNARRDDFMLMHQHLAPKLGERVLGFGEGTGFFCRSIAEAVGPSGRYVITDPSPELLLNIPQAVFSLPQVFTQIAPVEQLDFPPASFDKAWTCGSFHHCPDQTRAIKQIYKFLRPGGRMVIFDIFKGTALAKHFDSCVARYCVTGHEVKFLSMDFAMTVCFLAGFDERKVAIVNVPHRLCFDSEWDMGRFIYKMHALTLMRGTEKQCVARTIKSLKEHLVIERENGQYVLHFDQKGLIAIK